MAAAEDGKHENSILVVEDDTAQRRAITEALLGDGQTVVEAEHGRTAMDILSRRSFGLIITDLNMPGVTGMDILEHVKDAAPNTQVVLISGFGTVDTAVSAMRAGAFDFMEKPINLERLQITVQRALERASLRNAFDYLRSEQPYIYRLDGIVAESPPMRTLIQQITRVAPTDVTVLLTGETGTGKSLIAGAIHHNSRRKENALVTVNCAALSETLLESELFGHEKGAFTGAHKTRVGRFQQAHASSLFLDEVGDMSPTTQAETLRAIEDKMIQPLGSSRQVQVDVRIIAATNHDLVRAVEEGRFRQDLYYRLNVASLHIPPLRERREDVLPLAERFLHGMCQELGRPDLTFSSRAAEAMFEYHWPGNIRELRNSVERALLFAPGDTIEPADLGMLGGTPDAGRTNLPADTLNLAELERTAISMAMEEAGGVQKDAAKILGISPRALSYKLDKLDDSRKSSRRRTTTKS